MKNLKLLFALCLFLPLLANAQYTGGIGRGDVMRSYAPPRINTEAVSSPLCAGNSISVSYEALGIYVFFLNTFTAELSNASGSFDSPTAIGSLTSVSSGTIACTIPPGTPSGTGYRIRVVSSAPVAIGMDNGSDLVITTSPNATISYAGSPFCSSGGVVPVTRTGTAGGAYSASPAGLSINSSTGSIDPSGSSAGTYTVTYSVAAVGNCAAFSTTTSVSVTTAPSAVIGYAGSPYCSSGGAAAVVLSGTVGGAYAASPAGLSINGTTGTVDLGASTPGTYTVSYTIPAAGGCGQFQTTANITITEAPSATISYAGSPFCTSGSPVPVTRTGTAGGTYSASPAGLSINSSTGSLDPSASSAGTYAVTYTIAAAGGCGQFQTTANITITEAPSATVVAIQDPLCHAEMSGSIDLEINGGSPPMTYVWSYGAQVQDPAGLGAGVYTVVVTDQYGCEASAGATLTDPAPLLLTATTTTETQGNDGAIDLQVTGGVPPYTYAWSNGSTAQDILGLAGGTYTVEVSDANDCTGSLEVLIDSSVGVLEIDNGPAWLVALDGGAQLLTVSADMPFNAVELLDASGRMIHSKRKVGLIASMDVGHLSSGVYLVRIVLDEGPRVKRLFIGR